MSKQCYLPKRFSVRNEQFIDLMNDIISDYQRQGYVLTVRQLYYQLVARDLISNTLQEYKRVASIINDGKLAGLIDWDAIEDRTRAFIRRPRWTSGAQILQSAAHSYHQDLWFGQHYRVFCIVEKEALVGVLDRVCNEMDVPLLAARGYPSGSVLREFALEQIQPALYEGQTAIILHLGDHDPSGLDMTRDLQERISLFTEQDVLLQRLALNMDQVEELQPPENPAKATDARFEGYRQRYGESSWELDALSPSYLDNLLRENIAEFTDNYRMNMVRQEIAEVKATIEKVAEGFL